MSFVQPPIRSQLECNEGLLLGEIVIDHKGSFCCQQFAGGGECRWAAVQRIDQGRNIARAMVIDVRGAKCLTRKLLEQIILFVRSMIRAYDSDPAFFRPQLRELSGNGRERNSPRYGFQLAICLHKRRGKTFRAFIEIEGVAAFNA